MGFHQEVAYVVRLIEPVARIFVGTNVVLPFHPLLHILTVCHHAVLPCKVVGRLDTEETVALPPSPRQRDGEVETSVDFATCGECIHTDAVLAEVAYTIASHAIVAVDITSGPYFQFKVPGRFVVRGVDLSVDALFSSHVPAILFGKS